MTSSRRLLVVLVVLGLVVAGALWGPALVSKISYAVQAGEAAAAQAALSGVEDLSAAFKRVARAVKPSVVNISSVKVIRRSRDSRGEGRFFWFPRDFFGEEFERFFQLPPVPEGYTQSGQGTGVIVSEEGHVLTNNHVVAGADEVTVTLSTGKKHPAKVVGTDPQTDLAVIRIEASDLYPARLGDSEALEVGEWVLAVGNPFGLDQTITAGIVSAKGRSVGIARYEDFIQTDAAISPGNSGGPLVNLKGEVVGINTAIFSRSGGYMGIGFAIPIKMARKVMDTIVKEGKVTRGYLGVVPQEVTEPLARSFSYHGSQGALVAQVVQGSPADRGGLREGDIIVEVDGTAIRDPKHLREFIASLKPGHAAEVEVFRDGETKRLKVELGELSSQGLAAAEPEPVKELGLELETLTPQHARQLRLEPDLEGVLVTGVEPLSAASKAGLERYDVILSVQGKPVDSVGSFWRELRQHDLEKGVRLKVRRGSVNVFVLLAEKSGQ